jgi:hypothetical protein
MHAFNLRDRSEPRKSESLFALQNLPDLPSPGSRRVRSGQTAWLRRVALCFLLVSLALVVRSAWASLGVAGP